MIRGKRIKNKRENVFKGIDDVITMLQITAKDITISAIFENVREYIVFFRREDLEEITGAVIDKETGDIIDKSIYQAALDKYSTYYLKQLDPTTYKTIRVLI